MKRILSLFLSIVLMFSMITGTVMAEASHTASSTKLVDVQSDITGCKLNIGNSPNASNPLYIVGDNGEKIATTFSHRNQPDSKGGIMASIASDGIDENNDVIRIDNKADKPDTNSPYYQINMSTPAKKGKAIISGKVFYSGTLWNKSVRLRSETTFKYNSSNSPIKYIQPALDDTTLGENIASDTWYNFEFVADMDLDMPTVTITYTPINSSNSLTYTANFTSNSVVAESFTGLTFYFNVGEGGYMLYDDIKVIHDAGIYKAKITSVGSDGSVDENGTAVLPHSQNKVKFTLDRELPGLTKDHVYVKSKTGGTDITASEITVTSDATAPSDKQWIVEATLSQDLSAWSDYEIAISKNYYTGYNTEVSGTTYTPLTDITKEFSTPSAPLDIRTPQFENDGSATTDIISTIGNTDMTFVYTNTASGGYIKEVKSKDFSVNGTMNGASISFDNGFANGDTAKLFVIKGWSNPVPLFDKTWAQSYDGTVPGADEAVATSDALPGEITFGDFDYTGKKMDVNINVGSDAGSVNGVLYIYKRGTALKDNLIYADYVTTTANGSLKKEVTFASDINDVTAEYTAAFYADGIALSKDFPIYDSEAAFGGNIYRVGVDGFDKKYSEYSSSLTGKWSYKNSSAKEYASDATIANVTCDSTEDRRIDVYPYNAETATSGIHIVKFKFYSNNANSDGNIEFYKGFINVNYRDGHKHINDFDFTSLKADRWYDVEVIFDLESDEKYGKCTITDLSDGTSTVQTITADDNFNDKFTFMRVNLVHNTDSDTLLLYKDIQILADLGEEKPAIRYIGNNGIVDYGQKEVVFKISQNNGITKDNVYVKDSQGNVIKAKSISVTEDMGEYIITATLEKDLASWQIYTLMVDAIGYEEYRELASEKYVPVAPISRDFATPAAPIDITDPIVTSDGSSVTFEADITNTTGSSVDATTILAVVSSDGILQSVTADSDTVTSNKSFTNTNAFEDGNSAEYFVIKGFDNPVPLFNKTWSVNYDGAVPAPEAIVATAKAGAEAIVLDKYEYDTKFDHINKRIVVNLNTGVNAPVDGVLYVYSGDTLSAGSIVYANYVATANDGTLLKEIKLDSSIVDNSQKYTVAFYSNSVDSVIKDTFNVYDSDDYLNYKRINIFENVKKASTFSGIKQIITGTDDMGNVVNDAWTIFSNDADVSVYNTLKNKEAVYVSLISSGKSLSDYDALCDEFERLANAEKNKENNPTSSGPSSNNKNTGSSSVSMSATPSAGSSNSGASVGGSVFSDMSGHWGQKYVEALAAKGIINGYDDGSFRGDNSISRSELTKIIVEAFDISGASDNSFVDVDPSSWYYSYVTKAAAAGVVNGTGNGMFAPDNSVSRQDAVLMIWRAMNLTSKLPEGYKFFADEKDIQDYASDAIRCLGDLGIITGVDSKFLPLNNITRAEMAAVICRAIDYMESHIQ